ENWDGRGGQIVGNGVDKGGASRIGLATSTNLITGWQRWTNNPIIDNNQGYEQIDPPYGYNGGCEDPRIFKKDDTWYITYTGFHGAVDTCLATSQDLMNWTKKGPIISSRKNGVILPVKLNGKYYMYYGDSAFWVAWTENDDLTGWHDVNGEVTLFTPGYAAFDSWSMETSAPLMLCEDGILFLYFGVRGITSAERDVCTPHLPGSGGDGVASDATGIYSLGWALTSMNNPYTVLKRAHRPFLACEKDYELAGQVYGALFGESILRQVEKRPDNRFREKWYFHYGGGDTYMCVATAESPTNKKVLKYHLPVMTKQNSGFESASVSDPSALYEAGTIKMIYTAYDGFQTSLGKAESPDGFTFTRHPSPVLSAGTNVYDRYGVDSPELFRKSGQYYITYNGSDNGATAGNICLASSPDLINWTRYGEIFQPSGSWCRNSPVEHGVIVPQKVNNRWVMYFEGKSVPWESRIGVAYCDSDDITDPNNWYEPSDQPVLSARSGYFDSQGLRPAGRPIISSNKIFLFYSGWAADHRIMMGWVSFNRNDPLEVVERCEKHIIMPTDEFEGTQEIGSGSMVFMNNMGYIHYGAGKKNIGLALVNDVPYAFNIQVSTNTNSSPVPGPVSAGTPRFVAGLKLERSGNNNTISWSPVVRNEDNSVPATTNDIVHSYRIYRSDSADGTWSLLGQPAGLYYQDTQPPTGTYYYKVTACNRSGNESRAWAVVDSSAEKNTVALLYDNDLLRTRITVPYEASRSLWKGQNDYKDDLYFSVSRAPSLERGNVFYCYDIKVKKYSDDSLVDNFKTGSDLDYLFYYTVNESGYVEDSRVLSAEAEKYLKIFRFNNVEWVICGGSTDPTGCSVNVRDNRVTRFGLGYRGPYTEFTLTQLEPKKVFTPLGDYPHNEMKFYFANPEKKKISCTVYDLKGRLLRELPVKMLTDLEGYFSWDGRDTDKKLCRNGVYIYQLVYGDKRMNGTVILAK
ncbi:MAG: hypothetical protein PHF84_04940, partial [bacterium]|nr:hypothetical protein [bacterium]